jgi:hypothetical protein
VRQRPAEHIIHDVQQHARRQPTAERTSQRQPYPRMRTALRHLRQPLRLHFIKYRLLLLLAGVVPEQPSLEGGPRAAEAVDTAVGAAQMGSEGSMTFTQR